MNVKVYVEGGGDHNHALQIQCRRGFSEFLRRAGIDRRMPRIVSCGGRRQAYENYRTAHENAPSGTFPILLVDSEAPVAGTNPWEHVSLRSGDAWQRPQGASNEQIHLMVQVMEAWFHADKESLSRYYGDGFRSNSLTQRNDIENISKADLFDGLQRATKDCQKGEYSKGGHSFKILALIDPAKVKAASSHAARLLYVLDQRCTPRG